jgi:hypothetical protein
LRTPDRCRAVPAGRRAEAVPADLDAIRGVADDAGGVRSDHHRCGGQGQRRRDVYVPRHRQRAEVQGLPGVYKEGKDQKDADDEEEKNKLPLVTKARAAFKSIEPEQHFTEPPPRFNEATLVKELEADGVGRPSTYASILSTIQEREYVKKEGGKFAPTELGMVVTDLLLESFSESLRRDVHGSHGRGAGRNRRRQDRLARGHGEFYERFQKDLEHAERT